MSKTSRKDEVKYINIFELQYIWLSTKDKSKKNVNIMFRKNITPDISNALEIRIHTE